MDKEIKGTKYVGIILLSIAILIFMFCYSMTGKAVQNDTMSGLESEKQQNVSEQASVQEQASELQESKNAMEGLVSGLNSELTSLNENLESINTQINEKTAELEQTNIDLESAKAIEQEQYDTMKIRIRFMFEQKNDNYLDIFLSGNSFADSLNKAEYVSNLVKYDRQQLKKYKETKELIVQKEADCKKQQADLLALKEQAQEQQKLIQDKINTTNQQIIAYAANISDAEARALEYEKRIEANNQAINDESIRIEESSIMERESKEKVRREQESREKASRDESIRQQAAANGETTSPQESESIDSSYVAEANDVDKLAALIECEAGNQEYYGKLCVGAVVVNRINSSSFPDNLTEVIYQPYQFTPVSVSGRFALVLARGASAECYQAAREVLEQGNIVGSWLFFRVNDGSRQGDVIGDHVFY